MPLRLDRGFSKEMRGVESMNQDLAVTASRKRAEVAFWSAHDQDMAPIPDGLDAFLSALHFAEVVAVLRDALVISENITDNPLHLADDWRDAYHLLRRIGELLAKLESEQLGTTGPGSPPRL